MTTHDCGTGCGRPATSHICPACATQLEDALARLGTWAHHPSAPAVIEWCSLATGELHGRPIPRVELSRDNNLALPSSIFDSPSGRASVGKTQGLAAELDTQRARQTRRGSMNGPRLAPGPKLWWPYQGGREAVGDVPAVKPKQSTLDRVETQLARAVALWVGRLTKADHSIPTITVTGSTLARACTLLLWHSKDITAHPDAAEAHRAFTDAAERIEKLVDRPEDSVYVGPCWHVQDDIECLGELKAKPGAASVQCRVCGHVVGVAERRAWLADHLEEVELTATNVSRALAQIGLTVSRSHIDVWATRGSLISRGRANVGGRSLALYRVGDVMLLAYKAAEDPRARRSSGRISA